MKKNVFEVVGEEWRDYFETGDDKINKEKFKIEEYDFSDLLNCYKKWSGEETNKAFLDSYETATKLLKKYEIHSLDEDEINEFIEEIEDKEYWYRGIFFSAVINELYKDEEIHLSSDKIDYFSCYNEDKKIVVEGDCRRHVGRNMNGGKIKIYGNFDPREHISDYAKSGEIYHKDKLVWKDGEFVGLRCKIKKVLRYLKGDSI